MNLLDANIRDTKTKGDLSNLRNNGSVPAIIYGGEAVKKIKNSVIKNLVITDTIDNNDKIKGAKNIEVLPISGLMGEAIKRISNSTSVSDLFK